MKDILGNRRARPRVLALVAGITLASVAHAGGEQELQKIIVTGRSTGLVGVADSANVGTVTQKQLEARTVYRPGELLEATPGLVVSQHSGEGKANQFYLRGFNLDHGTDLRTSVDGMLVNQRSHGHGQGWTDLNFLIPELATGLRYRKGPYYASEGDFVVGRCGGDLVCRRTAIGHRHRGPGPERLSPRAARRTRPAFGAGKLLYALEALRNDGPFDRPDDYRKFNGVLRYSQGDRANGWNVTGMAYDARWNATDQIPLRAVESGRLGRFGLIDPTDGGTVAPLQPVGHLAPQHRVVVDRGRRPMSAHWNLDAVLQLHLLPRRPGRRRPVRAARPQDHGGARRAPCLGREVVRTHRARTTLGVQLQGDRISNALLNTKARQTLSTTRRDHDPRGQHRRLVRQLGALDADLPHRRRTAGRQLSLRGGQRPAARTRGRRTAGDREPEAQPDLRPVRQDRAATSTWAAASTATTPAERSSRSDPKTGDPADPVTPLARSKGFEVGHAHLDRCRGCRPRCRCTSCASTRSWCSSVMRARPRRAGRAGASASSSPTTTGSTTG